VKTRPHISLLATLTVLLGVLFSAAPLRAKQSSPPSQSPSQPTPDQGVKQPPSGSSGSAPDASTNSTAGTQTFTGVVAKQGDKYVLQADNGTVYDIDHQDEVQKFDGKKVRVHGTLDPNGKMIHLR